LLASTALELGMRTQGLELVPTLQARDPRIMHIALALQEEAQAGSPGGRIFTDSLATALAARLVQNYACASARTLRDNMPLQPWRLRRVSEYVDAHLDQDLSLAQLAAVAGFSVSHFKPLFKRATGMAVHQYVIERRVARARQLLLTGDQSLSEIALQAGFSHQSHMARWLRRLLGTTPAALARVSHRDRE
jgi:AraC family transcriptional regulator